MAPPLRLILIVFVLAFTVGGCGTTAIIARSTGPSLEATIDRSDVQALYVTTREGFRYQVQRSDVVAVRHPGSLGLGVALLVLAATSLVVFIALDPSDDRTSGSGFVAIPRIMALTGFVACSTVGLVLGGTNLRSRSAAGLVTLPAEPAPPSTQP